MQIEAAVVDGGMSLVGADSFFAQLDERDIPSVVASVPGSLVALAQELGVPRSLTWVVSSSLEMLQVARSQGFRSICILRERDARRQDEFESSCDILVHGWAELSLSLIEDYAPPVAADEASGWFEALIVNGSPEPSSPELVKSLAGEADYVIAADRGAESLHAARVVPDVFCGDADSVSPEVAAWARQRASADILYPSEKYESDLGLAVACSRHEASRRRARLALTLTCTSGGRPDHALTVMGSLVRSVDAWPRVVEDGFECRILSPRNRSSWRIEGARGATFSAVALSEGSVISEEGSKWELDHRKIDFLGGWGLTLSNVVARDVCTVTCHEGMVAVFLIGASVF